MNERIRELVSTAQQQAISDTKDGKCFDVDLFHKKFAELIVQECLGKIENEADQYAEPVWAFALINDIKEHFGIEE